MVSIVLILLGLCFGSFMNAFVWRLHQKSLPEKQRKASKKELSILHGRSMCVYCGHTLSAVDLIPVISWLGLGGRCRYCRKKISWQYPLVEALTVVMFLVSYWFWPYAFSGWGIAGFVLWLISILGFTTLIIYDLRWMLLPNKIIFPLYGIAAAFVLTRVFDQSSLDPLIGAVGGILIGGGIFYLLFQISDGKWIGGGDVKLGFLLGALLGSPSSAIIMLFLASLMGTIIALPMVATGKARRSVRIPFGPFLIFGAFIALLSGSDIISWYISVFIDI
jgi:prepilin signal peptidase PulO-like enzyme (type II secretory pathway)